MNTPPAANHPAANHYDFDNNAPVTPEHTTTNAQIESVLNNPGETVVIGPIQFSSNGTKYVGDNVNAAAHGVLNVN